MRKNILIIGPSSHGYNDKITEVLIKLGYDVVYKYDFDESYFSRGVRFFSKNWYQKVQQSYFSKILRLLKNSTKSFELVLIIRGYSFKYKDIIQLKSIYPKARFILYQWDPLNISRFDSSALRLFDSAYTFDYNDATKYPKYLQQKSLFYTETENLNLPIKYKLSFVGTEHSNRIELISKISSILSKENLPFFIYVSSNRVKYFKNIIMYTLNHKLKTYVLFQEHIYFTSLQRKKAQQIMHISDIVLDIHDPSQSGLSIRVLEALGKGKRLVTTNVNIMKEPFYKPSYIYILDQLNFNKTSFLDFIYKKNDLDIPLQEIENYKLENWIMTLIN